MARALDLVGERWTILLIRDLLLGPRRFSDLRDSLAGITPNLLSARLRHLQGEELILKRKLLPPARSTVYELTDLGRELEPVVLALGRFGSRYMQEVRADDRVNIRWAMVSLKRRYRCPSGPPFTVALEVFEQVFALRVGGECLEVRDGDLDDPDLRLRFSHQAIARFLRRGSGARELLAEGALELSLGRRSTLTTFARSIGALA